MAMTRSNFPSLLVEGLRDVFFQTLDQKSLVYPSIFEIKTSRKKTETDQGVASIAMLAAKNEGVAITYDDFVEAYETSYTHTTYAKGIRITEELMEDELYGIMGNRTKALGNSARYRLEYDHASLFNNAGVTTIFTGGDGMPLLGISTASPSTAHPLAASPGSSVSNLAASDLSLSALETACTFFRKMVDDRNMLVAIEPAILLVPPELAYDAWEITNSDGKPYTADNEKNYFRGRLDVKVWDFLTDTNAWFILANKRYGAPISFKRKEVSMDRDGDFDTGDLKMKARTRYSFGFSDWRWVYGSNAST